jgi:hypothetical protein
MNAAVADVSLGGGVAPDRYRHGDIVLDWPRPVGVAHGEGTASCLACHHEQSAKRAALSPDVLADPAEPTARGEPPP